MRQSVSFDDGASSTCLIPSRDEYTEMDKRCMWFQRFEYDQIRANNKILQRRMKHSEPDDDQVYCYRGLEHKSSMEIIQHRRMVKSTAALAVFTEQMNQEEAGIMSAELIRKAYRACTVECHVQAHQSALRDARTVYMASRASPEEKKAKTYHYRPTPGDAAPVMPRSTDL